MCFKAKYDISVCDICNEVYIKCMWEDNIKTDPSEKRGVRI
jgi:hypothetical protein